MIAIIIIITKCASVVIIIIVSISGIRMLNMSSIISMVRVVIGEAPAAARGHDHILIQAVSLLL